MFDEYLELPSVERPVSRASTVQVSVVSAGTPSSTTIDKMPRQQSHSAISVVVQPPIPIKVLRWTHYRRYSFCQLTTIPSLNVFAPELSSEASHLRMLVQLHHPKQTVSLPMPFGGLYNSVLLKVEPRNVSLPWMELGGLKLCRQEIHEYARLQLWD
ncbi:hypothetical protein Tco_0621621 [Tanacetum coccineum]